MSRPRSWCRSGTAASRPRTAACRITSVARSRTGAACCCRRRRAPETYAFLTLQVNSPQVGRGPACAHPIRDMLNSNPMLFIRGDEAGETWRIIDTVMNAWKAGDVPMQQYPAGQEDHAVAAPEGTIPRDRQGNRGSRRGR
jgi:hypothetical protein